MASKQYAFWGHSGNSRFENEADGKTKMDTISCKNDFVEVWYSLEQYIGL